MAVANLTARGGTSQGMNSGSRMYCPNANEMTAIAAGLEMTQVYRTSLVKDRYLNTSWYNTVIG